MRKTPLIDSGKALLANPKQAPLPPIADEELLSSDNIALDIAPPRASGTIKVRLVYAGRSKPMPFPDPDDETD